MIEAIEGLSFIDTTLRNNAPFMAAVPGGLWHALKTDLPVGVAPDQIFCVYQWLSGRDDVGGGGIRTGVLDLYVVKVTGPGSNLTGIQTAANLMDGLLHGASGATALGTIYYLLRQSDYLLPQVVNERLVLQVGGQYRTFVQRIGS